MHKSKQGDLPDDLAHEKEERRSKKETKEAGGGSIIPEGRCFHPQSEDGEEGPFRSTNLRRREREPYSRLR